MNRPVKGPVPDGVRSSDPLSNGNSPFVLAIDGPAGAGKSTVARRLAREIGLPYVDTGAMYRCVALQAKRLGIALDSHAALEECALALRIVFRPDGDGQRVELNGDDVTTAIREPEITRLASKVSAVPGVRGAIVPLQRKLAAGAGAVMEGRDIGTVVFPDARVKVFLTASEEERARRRALEVEARDHRPVNEDRVREEMAERDRRDRERAVAPLIPAPGAVLIDTDGLSIDQVVARIAELVPPDIQRTTQSLPEATKRAR